MTNEELDEAVRAAVQSGVGRFASICVVLARNGQETENRSVDRSLQRLRKAKRIKYEGGWKLIGQP